MCIRDSSNGELWRVALKRYGCPTQLTLELDPFKADAYYDPVSYTHLDVYKRQDERAFRDFAPRTAGFPGAGDGTGRHDEFPFRTEAL